MPTIQVTDKDGIEIIGSDRIDLEWHLLLTSSDDYAAGVLAWFDTDHAQSLKIQNGPTTTDLETWEVTEGS